MGGVRRVLNQRSTDDRRQNDPNRLRDSIDRTGTRLLSRSAELQQCSGRWARAKTDTEADKGPSDEHPQNAWRDSEERCAQERATEPDQYCRSTPYVVGDAARK